MDQSLYNKLGGFTVVRSLVSDFYDKMLDEPELAPFFHDTDMKKLVDHQTKFWSTALGGPASYTADQFRAIHQNMGITDRHFDQTLELARETLEDNDVNDGDVETIIESFQQFRAVVVDQPTE